MATSIGQRADKGISTGSGSGQALLNVLEPPYLIDIFLKNPPFDFSAHMNSSVDGSLTPVFMADFDLLTTLDDEAKAVKNFFKKYPFLKKLLTFPTLFVGTTATEYANYPEQDDYKSVVSSLLQTMRKRKASFLIVKDIPQNSPLLTKSANANAENLVGYCQENGFLIVEGQALAYVPLDFSSVDEFLKRLSKTRRKEFRKKLKEGAHVEVEELSCGSSVFFDESFLALLYSMYENVFAQSEIHFDKLTPGFFRELLQNSSGGGKVFCYKVHGELIGYNICFVHEKRLVDKYVGFVYPQARDANLYFISWFYNLEYAIKHGLEAYIAGWTDPAVKAALGAKFTLTRHAVFISNPILRAILRPFKRFFESDSNWIENN